MRAPLRYTTVPLLLGLAVACKDRPRGPESDSAVLPAQAMPAVDIAGRTARPSLDIHATVTPDSVLRVFLDLSLAGRRPGSVERSSVYTCREDEDLDSGVWMADARIDSMQVRGDTAMAHVTMTSVARQTSDGRTHQVTLKIEELRPRFVLIRDGGRWKVCGSANSISVTSGGQNMVWSPEGASEQKAVALIDSIRTARGLPLRH